MTLSEELKLSAGLLKYRTGGIFIGDTNHLARKNKARHIIKEFALAKEKWMGQTYEWWFSRCYGEPLDEKGR